MALDWTTSQLIQYLIHYKYMYSFMHLRALEVSSCQQTMLRKALEERERVSFVSMEQTQQTTIRVCLLQATYPFNSFHRPFKGSGGELYFPQKVFVTNQERPSKAPNLNRFLNPITDHPIRIPNGMDP